MYSVTCRNCGELNLFMVPPPDRVKCESCGNHFRTDGETAPSRGNDHRHKPRSRGADLDFDEISDRLGAMYPVVCTNCRRVNLILSPPPAQVNCDHCRQSFAALEEADIAVEKAYELWKSREIPTRLGPGDFDEIDDGFDDSDDDDDDDDAIGGESGDDSTSLPYAEIYVSTPSASSSASQNGSAAADSHSSPVSSASSQTPTSNTSSNKVHGNSASTQTPTSNTNPKFIQLGLLVFVSLALLVVGGFVGGLVGAIQFSIEYFFGWTYGTTFLMEVGAATILISLAGAMIGSLIVIRYVHIRSSEDLLGPFFGGLVGGLLGACLSGLAGWGGWMPSILETTRGFHLPTILDQYCDVHWPRFWERVGGSAASVMVVLASGALVGFVAGMACGRIRLPFLRLLRAAIYFAPLTWGGWWLFNALPVPSYFSISFQHPEETFKLAKGDIVSLEFSPNGDMLLVGGSGNGVTLWNVQSGKIIGSPVVAGMFPRAAFANNGTRIVTASDRTLTVWNTADVRSAFDHVVVKENFNSMELLGRFVRRGESISYLSSLSVSQDGQRAVTCVDKAALLWDLNEAKVASGYASAWEGVGEVTCAVMDADGWVFAGHRKGRVDRYGIRGVPPAIHFGQQDIPMGSWFLPAKVLVLAVSKNSERFAVAYEGRKVQICDANMIASNDPRQWIGKPLDHPFEVSRLAFSPNGKLLLTSCSDEKFSDPSAEVRLWDVERGVQIGDTIKQKSAGAIAFSPDGKTFVTGDITGTVKLWKTPAPGGS